MYQENDEDALDFVNQAIEMRGSRYAKAERIVEQITQKVEPNSTEVRLPPNVPPLQLQALIKGQRSSAIIMAVISVISIWFIPWAIFYIVLAVKLDPRKIPDRGLIKAAAILTLPLCLGLIPIIIDVEFWKMDKRLVEYEQRGASMFMPDGEWLIGEPKRKRGRTIALSILLSILAIFVVLIVIGIAYNASSNSSSSPESIVTSAVEQYKATNSLPQKVDDITTLTDVTADGGTLQYHYDVSGADTSNLTEATLYGALQPKLCSNTDTRSLLNSGVVMQYLYTVTETGQQYTINIRSNDC